MTSTTQTFLAVVLGAVLAALAGFVTTQMGIQLDRSRRRRDAALLTGEILAAVATLLRLAEDAAREGDFLDPLPSRFLGAARHEIDIYDRNRELLFSLANPAIRARLHSFVIRLSIPLDRLADGHARYDELRSIGATHAAQADALRTEMAATFGYLMKSRTLIPGLLAMLQPLARSKFGNYGRIDSDGNLTDIPPAPVVKKA